MSVDQPGLTDAPLRFGDRSNGTTRHPLASPPRLRQPTSTDGQPENRRASRPALVFERAPSGGRRRKQATLKARRVRRIIRRFDPWSVLKVSFIFFLCVYVVSMVALVLLWNLAAGGGVIENIESFIEDLGAFQTFEFEPGKLLQGAALGGAVLAVLATGLTALGSVLFNLISDLVGGVRLTVIEEPSPRPASRSMTSGSPAEGSDTVTEPSGAARASG